MDKIYDIIVIGAGPAGLSAAIYGARARFNVLILEEKEIGGQISITSEVVNYPGIKKTSGSKLTSDMEQQAKAFGAKFQYAKVVDVDFSGEIKIIHTDQGDIKTLGVIIATGSNPRMVGFPGEDEFKGRGIAYCATCDGEFFQGMDIFVVGAGYAAAEEAMFLTRYAKKVTIIAREPQFTCALSIAQEVENHDKIQVKFNTEVVKVGGDNNLKYAVFHNNETGETWEYQAEQGTTFGIFIFIGYAPASSVFKNHIQLDEQGYIITTPELSTNVKGVYAAGDICVKKLRQVVTAVSDGAIASTNLEKYVEELRQKLGLTKTMDTDQEIKQETKQEINQETNHNAQTLKNTRILGNSKIQQETELESHAQEIKQGTEVHEDIGTENFLDEETKEKLIPIFQRMERPIKLIGIIDKENELSPKIKSFLLEFKEQSEKVQVSISEKDDSDFVNLKAATTLYPSMLICDRASNYLRVSFHGVPGGHEFNSFIIALYNAAGPGQQIEEDMRKQISKITTKTNIKIAVSLSCTMCPDVVMAATHLAILNPNIEAEMIDIGYFPEIRQKYNIMSVPCIIINDEEVYFGKKSLKQLLDLL